MAKWTSIFVGKIEGRPVNVEAYDEGGCRVRTTQGADDPGTVKTDGSSTIIMTPTGQGTPIILEGSLDEIRTDLISEGFSAEGANQIVEKLPV